MSNVTCVDVDADWAITAVSGITGTTPATATLIKTLTKSIRTIFMSNDSSGVYVICKKRAGATGDPVPFAMLTIGFPLDPTLNLGHQNFAIVIPLQGEGNVLNIGDQIYAYESKPSASINGNIFFAGL